MALRDLFGGNAPQYKLPAALGSTNQALTVAAGSKTLAWAAAGGGATIIDSGQFTVQGANGPTGFATCSYTTYADNNLITVCVTQSTDSSLSLTGADQFLESVTAVFAGYAPLHTTGGAIQFKDPALTTQRQVALWEVATGGQLIIVPLNYSATPAAVDIMPFTIQWRR